MNKTIFTLLLLPLLAISQTPRSGGINNGIAPVIVGAVHDNFVGVQHSNSNAFGVYSFATSFDYNIGLKNTDDIAEGSANKYFSNALARNAFSSGFGLDYSTGIYSLNSTVQGILSSVPNKLDIPMGSVLQYIRGDGSLATMPSAYSFLGTALQYTKGDGTYATFPTIPTNTNQLTNGSNFISATSTDNLVNKTGNISQWTNNAGYLTAFNELDPTVPPYSKSLTAFTDIKNSTDFLYKAISYTPSSLEIITTLGYTPVNPNGTNLQYIAGDGTKVTFPSIPTILPRVFTSPTFSSATTPTQLSTTRDTDTSYSFDGTIAITLLGGQGIEVVLTYADNSAMTLNPVVVDRNGFSSSGLAGLSQTQTVSVDGWIPAGKYRQITFVLTRTGTSGFPTSPTVIKSGQEVQQ